MQKSLTNKANFSKYLCSFNKMFNLLFCMWQLAIFHRDADCSIVFVG